MSNKVQDGLPSRAVANLPSSPCVGNCHNDSTLGITLPPSLSTAFEESMCDIGPDAITPSSDEMATDKSSNANGSESAAGQGWPAPTLPQSPPEPYQQQQTQLPSMLEMGEAALDADRAENKARPAAASQQQAAPVNEPTRACVSVSRTHARNGNDAPARTRASDTAANQPVHGTEAENERVGPEHSDSAVAATKLSSRLLSNRGRARIHRWSDGFAVGQVPPSDVSSSRQKSGYHGFSLKDLVFGELHNSDEHVDGKKEGRAERAGSRSAAGAAWTPGLSITPSARQARPRGLPVSLGIQGPAPRLPPSPNNPPPNGYWRVPDFVRWCQCVFEPLQPSRKRPCVRCGRPIWEHVRELVQNRWDGEMPEASIETVVLRMNQLEEVKPRPQGGARRIRKDRQAHTVDGGSEHRVVGDEQSARVPSGVQPRANPDQGISLKGGPEGIPEPPADEDAGSQAPILASRHPNPAFPGPSNPPVSNPHLSVHPDGPNRDGEHEYRPVRKLWRLLEHLNCFCCWGQASEAAASSVDHYEMQGTQGGNRESQKHPSLEGSNISNLPSRGLNRSHSGVAAQAPPRGTPASPGTQRHRKSPVRVNRDYKGKGKATYDDPDAFPDPSAGRGHERTDMYADARDDGSHTGFATSGKAVATTETSHRRRKGSGGDNAADAIPYAGTSSSVIASNKTDAGWSSVDASRPAAIIEARRSRFQRARDIMARNHHNEGQDKPSPAAIRSNGEGSHSARVNSGSATSAAIHRPTV